MVLLLKESHKFLCDNFKMVQNLQSDLKKFLKLLNFFTNRAVFRHHAKKRRFSYWQGNDLIWFSKVSPR